MPEMIKIRCESRFELVSSAQVRARRTFGSLSSLGFAHHVESRAVESVQEGTWRGVIGVLDPDMI